VVRRGLSWTGTVGLNGPVSGSMGYVHVVLVGPMAVGKSTVARRLAARLGWPMRDSDDDLRAERGFSGRELAATAGVDALHRWESTHLRRSLADATPSVVAAAASVVDDPLCREAVAGQFVVWLRAPAATRAAWMTSSGHRRSLGPDPVGALATLDAERTELYEAVADLAVDAGDAAPDEIVATILDHMPVTGAGGTADIPS
jgi:shikimate kinase